MNTGAQNCCAPKHLVQSSTDIHPGTQSAFFVVRGEDLPRATFAKTIESIVEPLFSPAHFHAQGASSAVWPGTMVSMASSISILAGLNREELTHAVVSVLFASLSSLHNIS